MAVIYMIMCDNGVEISAYKQDDDRFENNVTCVSRLDRIVYPEAIRNILYNIFRQAGIDVIAE